MVRRQAGLSGEDLEEMVLQQLALPENLRGSAGDTIRRLASHA